MHTILGAGGPVANALAKELIKHQQQTTLVSRRPVTTFPQAEWVKADLKNYAEVTKAVAGSSVVYMCAGLKYDKKVWAVEWPLIMGNIIDAAKAAGARLIFFDNVYMYGYVKGAMTEDTPYAPTSKKGEVRARIAQKLMEEAKAGNIRATIARAADFYGAETLNSFIDSMVLAKYAKGQKALWLGDVEAKHAFTYVPDAGKAMYMLAGDPDTDGKVWHVPTAPAIKGQEFLQLAADAFNMTPKFMKVNKLMLQAIGLFTPAVGETAELYYQYKYDYIFDSSKFENHFKVKPTSYKEGIMALSSTLFQPDSLQQLKPVI